MATPVQEYRSFNILLADDDKDDRYMFEKALEQVSYPTQFNFAIDGEDLLDYLSKNLARLPDVLFLDMNMPRKNGKECLMEIKGNKKLKHIPVVIYSTYLSDETADTLYENGAHFYMHKSNFAELPKSISKILTMLAEDVAKPPRDKFIQNLQKRLH